MRVAVIQVAVVPDSRSANIARLMRMIVRACEREPAPDLLVLPCGCESAPPAAGANGVTRAMGDALAGLLAMQAREWGVFIAGGHWTRDDAGPLVHGVLLDADGDALIRTGRGDYAAGSLTHVRTTAVGTVGLMLGGQTAGAPTDDDAKHCDLLIVSGFAEDGADADSGVEQPGRAWGALARRHGCHVCVALPVEANAGEGPRRGRSQGPSAVYAPDGSKSGRAPNHEAVVVVEVALDAERGSG